MILVRHPGADLRKHIATHCGLFQSSAKGERGSHSRLPMSVPNIGAGNRVAADHFGNVAFGIVTAGNGGPFNAIGPHKPKLEGFPSKSDCLHVESLA